jgi:S-adenosyl-L-methionine hydrolase (adenosine-forming)
VTTIPGALLAGLTGSRPVAVEIGAASLSATAGRTFGDVPPGRAVVLSGSDGLVEIAVNGGRAKDLLAASPADPVRIRILDIGS